MNAELPILIEPQQLEQVLGRTDLRIIDLSKHDLFARGHIPGALFLDYTRIVRHEKPVFGMVPAAADLQKLFAELGLTPDTHVVACDDEGGGKAGRFLWTLDIVGHQKWSLLNGGMIAWANEGHPMSTDISKPPPGSLPAVFGRGGVAEKEYILSHLLDPSYVMLDCRSDKEFIGAEKRSEQVGHVPGAVHLDWMAIKDGSRNQRLLPDTELLQLLSLRGIDPSKEIIAYCHSHHRSALTYVALKHLGYRQVRGYPGSWSDWGNDLTTPVEC